MYGRILHRPTCPSKHNIPHTTHQTKGAIDDHSFNARLTCSMCFIIQTWVDEILQWDPMDYGYAYRMILPGYEIWLPEIALLNSVDEGNDLTLSTEFRYGYSSILKDILKPFKYIIYGSLMTMIYKVLP